MPQPAELAFAVLLAAACADPPPGVDPAASEDRAPPPSARTGSSESIADIVARVRHPALAAVEEELGQTLAVAPLPEARRPAAIAWATPPCPSAYHFDARVEVRAVKSISEGPAKPAGPTDVLTVHGVATIGARQAGGAVVRFGDIELGLMDGAVEHPVDLLPAGTFAETRLAIQGAQWVEVDGPTTLWSAFGSFPGLVLFFPALPGGATSTAWTLTVHEQGDSASVEAARGSISLPEGYPPPAPRPHGYAATVELDGWLDVAGVPVAVISARWTDVMTDEVDGAKIQTEVAFVGRYAVLASGRLLFAHVEGTNDVDMSDFIEDDRTKQTDRILATARLTKSCDGPVLAPPAP